MNAPRLALLALCAVAPAARADMTATSLQGWTRQDAYLITGGDRLIRGADYKDGVVYCDFRGNQTMMPSRAQMIFPTYPCVVLGWAPKGAPAKAGGLFATGRAYLQQGTGQQVSSPGSDTRTMVLDIRQVPYVDVKVMLLAPRATPLAQYESYVAGGTHLTQPDPSRQAATTPSRPNGGNGGGPRDPSRPYTPPSMIDRSSPASQWYVFDSADKSTAAASGSKGPVYCHIGAIGSNPTQFLKSHANTFFECVSLKSPVPAPKDKLLKAQITSTGRAQIDNPAGIRQGSTATLTYRRAAPSTEVLTLKRFRTLPVEHPGTENFFPTWRDPGTVPSSETAVAALTDKEKLWLTKAQRQSYAAPEKATEARQKILENLDPNADAIAKYTAAQSSAPVTDTALNAALPDKVWGADNKNAIGLSGPVADLQLSAADFAKLSSGTANAAALQSYRQVIQQWGGNGSGAPLQAGQQVPISESSYDPIALHNATMAARKALGGGSTTAPGGGAPTVYTNLSEAEKKFLTARELKEYEAIVAGNGGDPAKSANLNEMNRKYRAFVEARKANNANAYDPSKVTEANFKDLQDWQKRMFCQQSGAAAASAAGDRTSSELTSSSTAARGQLNDVARTSQQDAGRVGTAGASTAGLPAWAAAKCKDFMGPDPNVPSVNPAPTVTGNETPPSPTNIVNGPDKEVPGKEPNKWLTQDLLTSGAKGAMVGLLVGSLFGPAGLIAGPILGFALFYGLTKLTTKD